MSFWRVASRSCKLISPHIPIPIKLLLLFAAGLILIESASAQPRSTKEPVPIELESIVVTVSSISSSVDESSASITMIRKEEMEERQLTSVTELLRQIEGLHIDQAGGRGSVSSVYLRGADPNHTVVLIDGVKVNDPTNSRGGSFDFSTLNVDNIERIEIVRGPLSSVYGSEAIAGAIHIITKRGGDELVRTIDLSGGSFSAYRTLVETRGRTDRFDYSLSGSYLDNGKPVEGSEFIGTAFGVHLGLRSTNGANIQSSMRYSNRQQGTFPDDSGGPDFAVIRQTEHRDSEDFAFGMDFSQAIIAAWTPSLQIAYYDRSEQIDSPGVAPGIRDSFGIPPNVSDQAFRRYGFIQNNLIQLMEYLQLSLGFEGQYEKGNSQGALLVGGTRVPTGFELDRKIWALLFESRTSLDDRLTVEAGARLDWPDDFHARTSSRLGIRYKIPVSATSMHVSWGSGFKIPSFFALGHPIVGNADLDPEKSSSVEFGIRQPLPIQSATIYTTYFSNLVKDAIDFQETPVPMLVNRQETSSRGVEIGLSIKPLSGLSLSSHLTYLKTDIKGTDEELRNRPEWRGGASLRWIPHPDTVVHTDILYVGEVLDSSIPTGDRHLDDYSRINMAVTWNPSRRWQYYLSIQNLLNADFEEAIGFPGPGINVQLGIKASL